MIRLKLVPRVSLDSGRPLEKKDALRLTPRSASPPRHLNALAVLQTLGVEHDNQHQRVSTELEVVTSRVPSVEDEDARTGLVENLPLLKRVLIVVNVCERGALSIADGL